MTGIFTKRIWQPYLGYFYQTKCSRTYFLEILQVLPEIYTHIRHGRRKLFQSGRARTARQKSYRKFMWFELADVSSQVLKYDFIKYTRYEGLNYTILDKN